MKTCWNFYLSKTKKKLNTVFHLSQNKICLICQLLKTVKEKYCNPCWNEVLCNIKKEKYDFWQKVWHVLTFYHNLFSIKKKTKHKIKQLTEIGTHLENMLLNMYLYFAPYISSRNTYEQAKVSLGLNHIFS